MAEYKGFIGPTYQARSAAVSADRLVNWYPEIVESRAGKSVINYYPTPGLVLHADTSQYGVGRAAFALDGRQWAVVGYALIEFAADGTYTAYPGLADDGKPAYIVANARASEQLLIASGDRGYIFDTGALTLTPITGGVDPVTGPGTFNGCRMPAFLDDYLIALTPDSKNFQISNLGDGTIWSGLDFSSNLGSADNVKAIANDHEYLYLLGSKRIAVYANSGNSDFPIVPVPGAFIEQGIRAIASLKRYSNTLIFYGENEHGRGSVYRLDGFIPKRVSTHATEQAWCKYARDDDAVAMVTERDGHGFYRLTFPTGNQTWVYDLATDMWHERASWDAQNGVFNAQIQRHGCYSDGRYYMVATDGKIYREQNQTFTEDGRLIRRLRIAPVIANQNKTVFVTRLEIVIDPGQGLDGDPTQPGVFPRMMLRYSGDSGRTWSAELTAMAGRIGEYSRQVVFDQLGSGRAWVPEIAVTDPINWVLIAAQIEAKPGKW